MTYKFNPKRFCIYGLVLISFLFLYLGNELHGIKNMTDFAQYAYSIGNTSFNYYDSLSFINIYLPMSIFSQYALWQQNSQYLIRYHSKINIIINESKYLLLDTVVFWLIFYLVGLTPLMLLAGTDKGIFLLFHTWQTIFYFLMNYFMGALQLFLYHYLPRHRFIITLMLILLCYGYFSLYKKDYYFIQYLELFTIYYHDLPLNLGRVVTVYGTNFIIVISLLLGLRLLLSSHEEYLS